MPTAFYTSRGSSPFDQVKEEIEDDASANSTSESSSQFGKAEFEAIELLTSLCEKERQKPVGRQRQPSPQGQAGPPSDRKANKKMCVAKNCTRRAYYREGGIRDHCTRHGGVPRCSVKGCSSRVSYREGGKRGVCGKHGGHPECEWPGCSFRQFLKPGGRRGFCSTHGGIPKCSFKGCHSLQYFGRGNARGFCGKHGNAAPRPDYDSGGDTASTDSKEERRHLLPSRNRANRILELENDESVQMRSKSVPQLKAKPSDSHGSRKRKRKARTRIGQACIPCHNSKIRCEPSPLGGVDAGYACMACTRKHTTDSCKPFIARQKKFVGLYGESIYLPSPKNPKPKFLKDSENRYRGKPCTRTEGCARPMRHPGHCKSKLGKVTTSSSNSSDDEY